MKLRWYPRTLERGTGAGRRLPPERTVVVVKRSLSPGFAGIPNPLFASEKTLMMFGDGKKAMLDLVAALKA